MFRNGDTCAMVEILTDIYPLETFYKLMYNALQHFAQV